MSQEKLVKSYLGRVAPSTDLDFFFAQQPGFVQRGSLSLLSFLLLLRLSTDHAPARTGSKHTTVMSLRFHSAQNPLDDFGELSVVVLLAQKEKDRPPCCRFNTSSCSKFLPLRLLRLNNSITQHAV